MNSCLKVGSRLKVLRITNNIPDYPECKKDTLAHPEIVKDVEDEMDLFVYDEETRDWWPADEFFSMEFVRGFTITEMDEY